MMNLKSCVMCQCEYIFVFLRFVVCSAAISAISSHSAVNAIHWDHAVDLNDDYRVLWNIVGQEITFEVQVRTLGYIGLGFSLDGKLPGSDVAIGWVSQGQAHFQVSTIHFYPFAFRILKMRRAVCATRLAQRTSLSKRSQLIPTATRTSMCRNGH